MASIAGGLFPGNTTVGPAGRRTMCRNGRLRHMLIGYARVSKTDGSQSLDLQRANALRAAGVDDGSQPQPRLRLRPPRRPAGARQLPAGPAEGRRARGLEARPPGVATSPIWSTPCTTPVGPRGGPASACRRRSADRHHDRGRPPRVWHLRATLAEFERELIRERTVAGLKAARARGCTEDDEGSTNRTADTVTADEIERIVI